MRFFKRQAPNNKKKVDLIVKSRIITDPNCQFPGLGRAATRRTVRCAKTQPSILYSQL